MHKDGKYKVAASLAATVALSAALFLLFFSIEALAGYFNPRLFKESLRASDYGASMEQEMLGKQRELFAANGLPESLVDEIWEENEAYLAFYKYIDGGDALDGDQGQQEAIEDYLKRQNVYETDSVKEVRDVVVKESKAICRRYIYPSFVAGFRQFTKERRNMLAIVLAISAIFSFALTALLFCRHKMRRHALRYVTGSVFTAAIWNIAGGLFLTYKSRTLLDGTASPSYQKFLETYQGRGMIPWHIVSIAAVCMAIILLIANMRMRKRG